MFLFNIELGKIIATNCLDYFTKTMSLHKCQKEEKVNLKKQQLLSKKKQQGLLVVKVIHLSYGYKIDENGEICTMVKHKVIYIDETSKVFSVHKSASKVSIQEVKEEDIKAIVKRIS